MNSDPIVDYASVIYQCRPFPLDNQKSENYF